MFLSIHRRIFTTALLLCSPFAVLAQGSQPPGHDRIDQALRSLNRGHSFGQVAVSPDGKRMAWIQGAREGAEIRVAPIGAPDKSARITAAKAADQHCREGELTWSPDSKALAFLSDCADPDEQSDLYITRLDAEAPRRVTELHGYVHEPAFSPDGELSLIHI